MEEWKDIKGFENTHQISNMGRIRTKDRYVYNGKRFIAGKVIKPILCTNGYYEIHLWVNGKRTARLLHRTVAEAFIPNPYNFPEINHKDENIANNCADNLEWCTSKYNANYGTRNIRMVKEKYLKPVAKIGLNGEIVKCYKSISEATRDNGADISSLIRVCKGRQKTCVGYKWAYLK